jgi:murein DD-endopeptidase MepM/ murein hydrolase activator NlpD
MKLLALIRTVLAAFLSFILKPVLALLNFVFLKLFAKIYLAYLSFAKNVGWNRFKGNFLSFLFSRKTVHLLLAILVVIVAVGGLSGRQLNAKPLSDSASQTLISGLITSEFSDGQNYDLIEETAGTDQIAPGPGTQYYDNSAMAVNKMKIATGTEETEQAVLADLGDQGDGMIVKPEMASTAKSKKTRKGPIEYVVQPGDVVGTIAANFDISVNTILWENNLSAYSLIRPGDKLIILPATGLTHKVAKNETLGAIAGKYGVDASEILLANNLPEDAKLAVGQSLFVPGGKKVYYAAPAASAGYNPVAVIKDLLKPAAVIAGKMLWPTVGHTITQYFSWRHAGLDIANKIGTPVYAAESGQVIDAGWSKAGYGNKVDIDNGGGMVTRYGHASKLLVKKGDYVNKGDVIMLMGSTGKSTGPHVHFEVRINGRVQNPLSYVR